MKKFFKKIAFASAMAMVVSAMPAQSAVAADGPQMYSSLRMYLNQSEDDDFPNERYAKIWNWKDDYVKVEFESDNEAVATVTKNKGLVTAVSVGTANVTATFIDEEGETVERTCEVTVKNNAVEAGISDKSAEDLQKMIVGDKLLVRTYRTDANGVDSWKGKDVITDSARFASDDTSVFTVTKTGGTVTAVGAGEATLSVWAVQSENPVKENGKVVEYQRTTPISEYKVKVSEKTTDVVTFQRAKLSADKTTLVANGTDVTLVHFTLYKAENLVDKETKEVQVRLDSTRGTLGFTNVTLENGVATVAYTSPILPVEQETIITATIVSADVNDEYGQSLINVQAAPLTLKLVPPTKENTTEVTAGANLVGTTVVNADRIILYFDQVVDANSFMNQDAAGRYYVGDKFSLSVEDNVPQTQTSVIYSEITQANVENVIANNQDPKSVVLVLKDGTYMTDNSKYIVNFVDKRFNAVVTSNGIPGNVIDAFLPSVLAVSQKGGNSLTEIVVKFSEPIPSTEVNKYKFVIDGIALDSVAGIATSDKWGAATGAGERATITCANKSTFRDEYVIKLGKDLNGTQIYFPSGAHSLTVNNVGDYAYFTDKTNFVSTATLDFVIVGNDAKPGITVEVQSPEQYLVTFNCKVANPGALVLQYMDTKDNNTFKNVNALGQNFVCTVLADTADGCSRVLIEVARDWTDVLYGSLTNYYNYEFRIYAPVNTFMNVANGKYNDEIKTLLLDPKMDYVDYTSPAIVDNGIKGNADNTQFEVTFTEPIQVPNIASEIITLAKSQGTVPYISAQIVAEDQSKTYPAQIVGINEVDMVLTIKVTEALEPGKNHILYVRSVSDDIGNTSHTCSQSFITKGAAAVASTEFQIAGVWADTKLDNNGIYDITSNTANVNVKDGVFDAVYVEFTTPIAVAGGYKTVLSNTNWSLNGSPLPAGAYIIGNIVGDSRLYGVTIVLPDGTITRTDATIVTVSKAVTDINGQTLKGINSVKTQYIMEFSGETDAIAKLATNKDYIGRIGRFTALVADIDFAATVTGTDATTKDLTVTITNLTGNNNVAIKDYNVTVTGIKADDTKEAIDTQTKLTGLTQAQLAAGVTTGVDVSAKGYVKYEVSLTAVKKDTSSTQVITFETSPAKTVEY